MGLSQENAHFLKENSTICRSFCKETMGHRIAISVLIYGRLYPTYVLITSQLYLYPTCIRIIVFSYLYNSLYVYIYISNISPVYPIYPQYIQYVPSISPSYPHHFTIATSRKDPSRRGDERALGLSSGCTSARRFFRKAGVKQQNWGFNIGLPWKFMGYPLTNR